MTFEQMKSIEPRLAELEADLRAIKDDKRKAYFCANSIWYGYKDLDGCPRRRMIELVGNLSPHPELRGTENYDIAYKHLYNLLPNCRNCMCA